MQCVREALRAGRRKVLRLWLEAGPPSPALAELRLLAEEAGVPVSEVDRLGPDTQPSPPGPGSNRQRVALDAGPLPHRTVADLMSTAPPRLVVVLDGVQDPQNLGAIARVAETAGVAGLVLPRKHSALPSPAASRASAGALEWLPVAVVVNLSRALEELADDGFWVVGAVPDADLSIYDVPERTLGGDLVVVLGGEAEGIRRGMRGRIDHPLRIPMYGRVSSLNVASSAAAILFEIRRRWEEASAR